MKKTLFIVGVIALIAGLIYWGGASKRKERSELESMSSREVALRSTTDMTTEYHIHPELSIFMNGTEVPIPLNLGVKATGMTAIHTHNEKGVIHVEAPIKKDFTLGDFFAVWGKDFSQTKLLDTTVDDKSEIIVTVNGQKVDTYENTVVGDKDKIVISYQSK
jgi:plastocyanin domain-containing protein